MAKQEDPPIYACMTPPADARRVHHPHEERRAVTRKPSRRLLSRLASALRR
jgi:hypothetical protein